MKPRTPQEFKSRRQGLTLVELLVAVGIFFLLLSVLLVPIRMAFDSLNIGRSRAEVQQAAQGSMSEVEQDLRKAVFVFPNTKMPPITDDAPYSNKNNQPYVRAKDTVTDPEAFYGPCNSNSIGWGNSARLDILVANTSASVVTNPVRPARYVVTYYARRLDISKPYDPFDNPIVLFRAQFPYKDSDDNDYHEGGNAANPLNADLSSNRLPSSCSSNAATLDRQALWLTHNLHGEANLEPLCVDAEISPKPTVFASHSLVTPRGMALEVPGAGGGNYQPNSSFICQDTNDDGKIDRVTFNLILANYSASQDMLPSGAPRGQVLRFSRVIDLPNIQ